MYHALHARHLTDCSILHFEPSYVQTRCPVEMRPNSGINLIPAFRGVVMYRGTSLIRNCLLLGPYSRTMTTLSAKPRRPSAVGCHFTMSPVFTEVLVFTNRFRANRPLAIMHKHTRRAMLGVYDQGGGGVETPWSARVYRGTSRIRKSAP